MDSFEWKSEEEEFSILLKSMGVKSCDKYVITALSDYAKRLATELLCDAKDYATHRVKEEIEVDDIQLLSKMSDNKLNYLNRRICDINQLTDGINNRPLEALLPTDDITSLTKYSGEMLTRIHTYVPCGDVYNSVPKIGHDSSEVVETPINADNMTVVGKRKPIQKLDNNKFPKMKLSRKMSRLPLTNSEATSTINMIATTDEVNFSVEYDNADNVSAWI